MMSHGLENYPITLDNFEGSIDFLLHLVQRDEIDIYEVSLYKIMAGYLEHLKGHGIDTSAEFIGVSTTLLWLKSKMLLPQHEQVVDQVEGEEPDPKFNISDLVDYCRFKEAAHTFVKLETEQNCYFQRGVEGGEHGRKPLGIEHVSLDDFAQLFQQLLTKTASRRGVVTGETWSVADKIIWLRHRLKHEGRLTFRALFGQDYCREELIVIFLAVLELMKMGELALVLARTNQEHHNVYSARYGAHESKEIDEDSLYFEHT
jgi:segregation and condensation protein A